MFEVRFTVSKQCSLTVCEFKDIRLISSHLQQTSSVICIHRNCEWILLKSGINSKASHKVRDYLTVTYTFSLLSQMYTMNSKASHKVRDYLTVTYTFSLLSQMYTMNFFFFENRKQKPPLCKNKITQNINIQIQLYFRNKYLILSKKLCI